MAGPESMLELGKPGSAGAEKGTLPVLRDGAVVAVLRASNWKERATAVIGGQEWVYAKDGRALTGRRAEDPEGTARCRARQVSVWKGGWDIDLEGTVVEGRTASRWRMTRRYLIGGAPVAESGSTGRWNPQPTLTVVGELPLRHEVFLLWLELLVRRRAAAASTA
jgi:hypothetical protein